MTKNNENIRVREVASSVVNVLETPATGVDGLDCLVMLDQVMVRFKDLPERDRRAAVEWFIAKYGHPVREN